MSRKIHKTRRTSSRTWSRVPFPVVATRSRSQVFIMREQFRRKRLVGLNDPFYGQLRAYTRDADERKRETRESGVSRNHAHELQIFDCPITACIHGRSLWFCFLEEKVLSTFINNTYFFKRICPKILSLII